MKITAVAWHRPGSAHCRGSREPQRPCLAEPTGDTQLQLGPQGRLGTLAWVWDRVKHARGRRDTGMRLRDMGPGQLKQDDRGPHPLTRECLPAPRLELSIHGAGSWAGPRAAGSKQWSTHASPCDFSTVDSTRVSSHPRCDHGTRAYQVCSINLSGQLRLCTRPHSFSLQ